MIITLTPAQIAEVKTELVRRLQAEYEQALKDHARVLRNKDIAHERKLAAAKARIADWKQRYATTRKALTEARNGR